MNHPARRLATVLLALALTLPAAAAPADPELRQPGTADGWIGSVLDLLGGLVDRLWIDAPLTAPTEPIEVDDGDSEAVPGWDPNGATSSLTTSQDAVPGWEPNG